MTLNGRFDAFKARVRSAVDDHLEHIFAPHPDTELCRAARYVTLGQGHRWRAMTAIAAGLIFDDDAFDVCLPFACAVELTHAASLVLDDLPSMDDAHVRRGKPCPHLVFSHWVVDMLPAFLVNMAYAVTLDNPLVSYERRVTAALLSSRAGMDMAHGQEMDVTQPVDEEEEERLVRCHRLKCGALYATAAQAGALICGASDAGAQRLYECGMNLGLAYQFRDDVADVVAAIGDLGKPTGADTGKRTAIDVFGVAGSSARARHFEQMALALLDPFGPQAGVLRALIRQASWAPV